MQGTFGFAQNHYGRIGYVAHTQWDVFMAFIGAIVAQVLLSRVPTGSSSGWKLGAVAKW